MVISGIVICAYARFLATLNALKGFYTLQLNYNQLFKESFLGELIPGADIVSQRMEQYKMFLSSKGYNVQEATGISNMMIAKSSAIQSQLLTLRAIFLIAAIITASIFTILVLFAVINKIKASNQRIANSTNAG